jgi:hypothetical protein
MQRRPFHGSSPALTSTNADTRRRALEYRQMVRSIQQGQPLAARPADAAAGLTDDHRLLSHRAMAGSGGVSLPNLTLARMIKVGASRTGKSRHGSYCSGGRGVAADRIDLRLWRSGVDLTLAPCESHTTSLRTYGGGRRGRGGMSDARLLSKGAIAHSPLRRWEGLRPVDRSPYGISDTKTLSSRIYDFFQAGACKLSMVEA